MSAEIQLLCSLCVHRVSAVNRRFLLDCGSAGLGPSVVMPNCSGSAVKKHHRPKVLRQASELPIPFRGAGSDGRSVDRVGPCVTGVTGDVGGCDSVTGGTGRCSGRSVLRVARGGVSGQCGGARRTTPYLSTRPGTCSLDRLARSVVFRVLLLEAREHVLGALSGPDRQRFVVLLVEPLGVLNLHR